MSKNFIFDKLGVMQGRLLPKYNGQYQSHPPHNWQNEFFLAKKLNLKHIEFIFDSYSPTHLNPLFNVEGLKLIKNLIKKNKIKVENICADYFMSNPLFLTKEQSKFNYHTLKSLIINSKKIGVKNIILPCVDQSSLNERYKKYNFLKFIQKFDSILEQQKIYLSLETDLPPKEFKKLIDSIDNPWVKINYDSGNSVSLGFNIDDEFEHYGDYISTVHIKDRKLNGPSVILGKGELNLKKLILNLKKINYRGIYTMQVYRDNEGYSIFKKQLKILNKLMN